MFYNSVLFALVSSLVVRFAAGCNSDNCLRALSGNPSSASSFSHTYTVAPGPSTPAFASPCSASPSRLSSACSCLAGSSTTGPTTSKSTTTSSSTTSSSTTSISTTSTATCPSTCTAVSTFTLTITSVSTMSATASTITDTLPASTLTDTLPASTVTDTPPASTLTDTLPGSTITLPTTRTTTTTTTTTSTDLCPPSVTPGVQQGGGTCGCEYTVVCGDQIVSTDILAGITEDTFASCLSNCDLTTECNSVDYNSGTGLCELYANENPTQITGNPAFVAAFYYPGFACTGPCEPPHSPT